jgi:hypothetical protein
MFAILPSDFHDDVIYELTPLHKGPFWLESVKFVSMTRFYSRNVSTSVFLGGILGNSQKYGRIYPVGTDLRTPYRVRILAPLRMLLVIAASP